MANKEKVKLKFSDRQFELTYDFIKRENRKKTWKLKIRKSEKMDKIKALKLKLLAKKNKEKLILILLLKIH